MSRIIRYCPECGHKKFEFDGFKVYHCASCGFEFFFNTATAVSAIIVDNDRLLAATRARDPGKGLLDLPGGFVDPGESLEIALQRELVEELSIRPLALSYLTSATNFYHYKAVDYTTCDCFFLADFDSFDGLNAGDDVSALQWIQLSELNLADFAFDSVKRAIKHFLNV